MADRFSFYELMRQRDRREGEKGEGRGFTARSSVRAIVLRRDGSRIYIERSAQTYNS